MDIQDRYDELVEFIDTIKCLRRTLKSKDLVEECNLLLFDENYVDEKLDLEHKLAKMQEQEDEELEREYDKVRL